VRQVLVHWRGEPAESASWEDLDEFRSKYPDFQLEDELGLEGGEMSCAGAHIGAAVTHAALQSALNAHRRRPQPVDRFRNKDKARE
jgi:transcriptional regulator GlxA family with amidase domain